MTGEIPVFWGHGVIEPYRAHVRETIGGQSAGGFAICGCLLVADVTDEQLVSGFYQRCSRCVDLLANREPGIDYPLWTS